KQLNEKRHKNELHYTLSRGSVADYFLKAVLFVHLKRRIESDQVPGRRTFQMWLRLRRVGLLSFAWVLLTELYCAKSTTPLLTFRWRSLNQSSGTSCTNLLKQQLNAHVNEALVDILMYRWLGEFDTTIKEVCDNSFQLTESEFLRSNLNKGLSNYLDIFKMSPYDTILRTIRHFDVLVCLGLHRISELEFIRSYYSLMDISAPLRAVTSIPAISNYQNLSESSTRRGYYNQDASILTSGPSIFETADAVYRLLVTNDWSYVAIVIEAEDGAVRLSQALQSMSKADQRVCFPIVIQLTSSNATAAAKALRNFVYPDIPRLTVVYSGSGSTFLSLWDLVTGLDALTADLEKRYQLVLVGDALGSFYRATNSTRRRHFGLGTLFVFPGVLDPNPASDSLAVLLKNISSTPESMGEFHRLTDTWSRLQHFKSTTSEQCDWTKFGDLCYTQALIYDFQLLSFLPLIGSALDFSPSGVASLRRKSVSLSDLRSSVPFVDAFLRQNFTDYSLARGLSHRDRGFWQPIVKVYQSRFDSRSEAILEKLGELRIVQAGSANQNYEWDLSTMPELYEFRGGNPDNLPVKAVSGSSVCPRSCPECSHH
uniref:ANF_receptor domain-containing protein n=1 Tax=Macrostomum lignano TaxID=282301 RepID=A0A1I8GXT3_9PLAT